MADELRDIVQRMIDAGESEDNIAAVIKRYDESNPVEPGTTAGKVIKEGAIAAPGILAMATPAIRTGVNKTAQAVAESPVTQKIIAGGLGAAAGALTNAPPWVDLLGAGFGMQAKVPGEAVGATAKAIADATSREMPRVAGRFAALPAGRTFVNAATKALPIAGQAWTLADIGRWHKWLSEMGNKFTMANADTVPNDIMMTDILGQENK